MFKYRLLPGADATTRPSHIDCIPSKSMNLLRNGWNLWIRHNYIRRMVLPGGIFRFPWSCPWSCNVTKLDLSKWNLLPLDAWQNWILFCHSKDVTIIAEKPRLAAKKQVPWSAAHVFKAFHQIVFSRTGELVRIIPEIPQYLLVVFYAWISTAMM